MANQSASVDRDRLFHALSDPTRRAVVERLGEGEAAVTELAAPHAMALPSFLQHLRVLEAAGLVRSVKRGRVRTCSLDGERLAAAERWIAAQRGRWERRLDRLGRHLEGSDEEGGTP